MTLMRTLTKIRFKQSLKSVVQTKYSQTITHNNKTCQTINLAFSPKSLNNSSHTIKVAYPDKNMQIQVWINKCTKKAVTQIKRIRLKTLRAEVWGLNNTVHNNNKPKTTNRQDGKNLRTF